MLVLPGWQDSGPDHWQTRWERAHPGWHRVQQHNWMRPLRGDWVARLEEVLLERATVARPAVLVAHRLGCLLVAAWAAHSRNTARVGGALLVAPPDTERSDVREQLPGWAPIPAQRLPFPTTVVRSTDDPFCAADRAACFARAWGAEQVDAGARGHLNAQSGLGDWPEGLALIDRLNRHAVHGAAAGDS